MFFLKKSLINQEQTTLISHTILDDMTMKTITTIVAINLMMEYEKL